MRYIKRFWAAKVGTPLVSVVMPVRNGADSVGSAVQSMLAQSVDELELIVVDDGSTDSTLSSLKKIVDPRLVIVKQSALGIVPALNSGFRCARGRYIARMDADDWCPSNRLELQISYLEKNSDVGLVGSSIRWFREDGQELGIVSFPTSPDKIAQSLRTPENFWAIAHPTVLMDRERFGEPLRYRAPFRFAEDYDMWLRLSRNGHLANLSEPLCESSIRPKSLRKRRPFIAYKSALCAWLSDYAKRNGESDLFTVDGQFVKMTDFFQINAHKNLDAVRAALVFAWRLNIPPTLTSVILCALARSVGGEVVSQILEDMRCMRSPNGVEMVAVIEPKKYFEEVEFGGR